MEEVLTSVLCARSSSDLPSRCILDHMLGFFFKAFAAFWIIWILWYITGGPLRDDRSKPYIGFDKDGQLQPLGTSTTKYTPSGSTPK